jgi:hypothetical protein
MAGSDTTIDVCKAMKREVVASDIRGWRKDITIADAEDVEIKGQVDFVFMHVPYLDMYKYTENANDLSQMSLSQFEKKLDKIIEHVAEHLKADRFLAILVGDIRKSGLIDLSARVSIIGEKHLRLWDKAIVETPNVGSHASAVHDNMGLILNRAERFNFLIQSCDTLLIFRKRETLDQAQRESVEAIIWRLLREGGHVG